MRKTILTLLLVGALTAMIGWTILHTPSFNEGECYIVRPEFAPSVLVEAKIIRNDWRNSTSEVVLITQTDDGLAKIIRSSRKFTASYEDLNKYLGERVSCP